MVKGPACHLHLFKALPVSNESLPVPERLYKNSRCRKFLIKKTGIIPVFFILSGISSIPINPVQG
jgi:hypothetical protein